MTPSRGADDSASTTYAPLFFERLLAVEDRHFWFRARNRMLRALVAKTLRDVPGRPRLLELGCGNGNVLRALENLGRSVGVVGMDLFWEGLLLARRRVGCPLVLGDVSRPPFSSRFDLIGCFDVLEHLSDDEATLGILKELLAPRGALLLTVPAHQWLWSDFDTASHHQRRYEESELREKLTRAGFRVEFLSPYMSILLPPAFLLRRLRPSLPERDGGNLEAVYRRAVHDLRVIPIANGLLEALLSLEARWLSGFRRIPFGASLVAVARST